jgi:putative tryptophan/tyrosine transport system substrate-binding protein
MVQVIGMVDSATPESRGEELTAFYRGLRESGVDGGGVIVEYSWAGNDYSRLPALARQLIDRKVDVLVAVGGPVSALAAKAASAQAASKDTQIVFTTVADPVKSKLVDQLEAPGGNLTGTSGLTSELDKKRLALLREIMPKAGVIGVLTNPNRPGLADELKVLQAAAKKLKLTLEVQNAGTNSDIDVAFKAFAKKRVDAVLVTADPFFNNRRAQIVALAAKTKLPAIYQWPAFVEAGGLMSYGPSKAEAYHQAGIYAARILNGGRAATLPVVKPKKFSLVVDLAMAKALRLKIPPKLLARGAVVLRRP